MANQYRYIIEPAGGGENQIPFREIQNSTYAATISISPLDTRSEEITVDVDTLTGATSVTASTTSAKTGDRMRIIFKADGTNRIVTPSTGMVTAGTLTVLASKSATLSLIYSGSASAWVETGRFIQA